jgi:hypothetical protein
VSGAKASEESAYPQEAVRAFHDKPIPTHDKVPFLRPVFSNKSTLQRADFHAYEKSWRLGVKLAQAQPLHRRPLAHRRKLRA